ncbi:MAG: 3-hydroxybutyryl-CoA dehydrogenase [Candidatus Eisenbacteria bacterium]|nr:3-hydroxybutyryl-CoA dehydrogenase [Candidatus Eisenbacteria bacterium]
MDRNRPIAVIGSGTMGNGIAQVLAQSKFPVTLIDVAPEILDRAKASIDKSLERLVKKGALPADEKQTIIGRVKFTTKLEEVRDAQMVIEAIIEDAAVKKDLFGRLDALMPPGAILASNTSSISITELGAATKRADRVIGMHFMNPVPVMQLIEIIRGLATSDATLSETVALAKELQKTPVAVQDYPGFVANRILLPMINEAVYCLMENLASPEDIDTVMKLGMNHPMGPLALADLIGLDICLNVLNVLYDGLGDPKYSPCPLLVKMVKAGYLGRKTKRGFYDYNA